MAKRALIEKRPWLLASVAVAILFCALRLTRVPELWLLALPGAPPGCSGFMPCCNTPAATAATSRR